MQLAKTSFNVVKPENSKPTENLLIQLYLVLQLSLEMQSYFLIFDYYYRITYRKWQVANFLFFFFFLKNDIVDESVW